MGDPGRQDPPDVLTPFAVAVLDAVEEIPAGYAATYGDIARRIGTRSPRQVGAVLARHGAEVPWHRVVMADGSPAPHHRAEQLTRLLAEGVPLIDRGTRVDLAAARWSGTGE